MSVITTYTSIIVPVYNEESTIREVIERLLSLPMNRQVIVVDDGSTDRTLSIVTEYKDKVDIAKHTFNQGKGMAIRTGIAIAVGAIIVVQDGDLEYYPEELPLVIEPIIRGDADMVYGSRFITGFPRNMELRYRLVNQCLKWLARVLYGIRVSDITTGCKAMPTEIARMMDLKSTGFEICEEMIAKAVTLGLRIVEIPIAYRPRSWRNGKKIRWTDGFIAVWTLLKYRLLSPHR